MAVEAVVFGWDRHEDVFDDEQPGRSFRIDLCRFFRAIYRLYITWEHTIPTDSKVYSLNEMMIWFHSGMNFTFFIQTMMMIQWMEKVQFSSQKWLLKTISVDKIKLSFETRNFSWFLQISKSQDFQIFNLESMFLIRSLIFLEKICQFSYLLDVNSV